MIFNPRVKTAKARDFNWHHVFGFWIFVPLFLVVISATPISYTWARNTVYVLAAGAFDRVSGELVGSTTFADRTTAGKVLSYFRWVHTGEAHGLVGQTIAGVVSAIAVLMAWTGVALSWRRLISPVIRRRQLRHTRGV